MPREEPKTITLKGLLKSNVLGRTSFSWNESEVNIIEIVINLN